jgi:hypothetical protein
MAEWEIEKTIGQCYGTGLKFEVGQEYFAALVETEQGFQRRDYSVEYWEENKPSVYCYWKTKMTVPGQKRKLFVDDDMLMTFFERLAEETDPERINFRFIITLVLMRRRRLKYNSSRIENGTELWTLRVTAQDRTVEVVNPDLTEDKIEQLSCQISQILQVDL